MASASFTGTGTGISTGVKRNVCVVRRQENLEGCFWRMPGVSSGNSALVIMSCFWQHHLPLLLLAFIIIIIINFFFFSGSSLWCCEISALEWEKKIIQQERGTRGRFGHVTQGYALGAIRFGIFANLFTLSVLSEMFVCIACLFPRWIPDAYRTLSVYVFDALERKKAFRDIAGFLLLVVRRDM